MITTVGPLPGAADGGLISRSLAERGADGWTIAPLPFPDLDSIDVNDDAIGRLFEMLSQGPKAFTPDLSPSASIWTNRLPVQPGQSVGGIGLFRREPLGQYTLLADMGPGGDFEGASEDLQRVVFTADDHLLPADAGRIEGHSVYELVGLVLRLVDVDDTGSPLSECGSTVPESPDAVSRDGERIFLASPSPSTSCPGPSRVYLREGGETTEVSASRCTRPDCDAEQAVSFAGATTDGSSAFLVTAQQLTNDDVDSIPDLYRYDVTGGNLSRISSPRPPGFSGAGANEKPVRVSADGSRIYFVFNGPLTPGQAEDGRSVFYLADDEGLHYVARDDQNGFQEDQNGFQISRDGRYAVFSTDVPLDAADTDVNFDVYRYDAVDRTYTLLSGGTSIGNVSTFTGSSLDALNNDGETVFFSTEERLLPEDRNEVADVYEWSAGALGLVSAGAGDIPGFYLGTSPDGRTVLFGTGATLLPPDRDGGDVDVYSARVGGGFAEPMPALGCDGEACRGALHERANRPPPRSTFSPGRIELARIGPIARRRIAATGWMTLRVEVPVPGRLSARAQARIGHRLRMVASAAVDVEEAGPVRLRVPLTGAARRSLERGSSLRVRLVLHLSRLRTARAVSFTLTGPR